MQSLISQGFYETIIVLLVYVSLWLLLHARKDVSAYVVDIRHWEFVRLSIDLLITKQYREDREIGKTPKKEKTQSGFQKRVWKYESEALDKNSRGILGNCSYERRGRLQAWWLSCNGYRCQPIPEKEYKRSIILEEVVKVWNEFLTKKLDIFACILLLVIAWLSYF